MKQMRKKVCISEEKSETLKYPLRSTVAPHNLFYAL